MHDFLSQTFLCIFLQSITKFRMLSFHMLTLIIQQRFCYKAIQLSFYSLRMGCSKPLKHFPCICLPVDGKQSPLRSTFLQYFLQRLHIRNILVFLFQLFYDGFRSFIQRLTPKRFRRLSLTTSYAGTSFRSMTFRI